VAARLESHLDVLRGRVLSDGGFCAHAGSVFRPDATAWAVLVLQGFGLHGDLIEPARTRLAASQLPDGRVSLAPDHPETIWPTALAILAWHGWRSPGDAQARALDFLVRTSGGTVPTLKDVVGHDGSIPGWPWIANTHSWVEPTALGLIALRVGDRPSHARATQAVALLMDRQLPDGGWNYGNTIVFGQVFRPDPDSTGVALSALSGLVAVEKVRKSLDYLMAEAPNLRTPIALGWALLGLGAWGRYPEAARSWVLETVARQDRYGEYDTQSLCLLLAASGASSGLIPFVDHGNA
jgi:hypothetical protein